MQEKTKFAFRRFIRNLVTLAFPFIIASNIASAGEGPSIGYNLTPWFPANNNGARLKQVRINGTNIGVAIQRGKLFTVNVSFDIVDEVCTSCIDQILVGFSHGIPTRCVYSGIPGSAGEKGTKTFTVRAPNLPGKYYLAFDRAQQFSCEAALALKSWQSSATPAPNQYFAVVDVY